MRIIFRLVVLTMLSMPANAFAGDIIRIKKKSDTNRNRYSYTVTYLDASSTSLKAKMLARKYGGDTEAERSEDGLQVKLIKTK